MRSVRALALRAARAAVLLLGAASLACGRSARGAPAANYMSADDAERRAIADSTQWATYGRDFTNQRWSPLAQITPTNVKQLAPAWVNHSGIPHASETNPVVVNGTMYFTTALNHVIAVDAATGKKRWEYVHEYRTTVDCCASNNKGVAVYDGRVYMGTVDARLVALDARSGRKEWDVSVGDNDAGYHVTGAPFALAGKVIIGVSGGEQGCRCYVDAYDARTGQRLWRWYTIPAPNDAPNGWWGRWRQGDEFGQSFHRDVAQEKRDSAKYADAWRHGGGPMWHHPAYDPETGLLYMNIGNPSPDNNGVVRPGDNLYTCSVVAVELRTGKLRWYYQEVSHDRWDYDATTPPVLITVADSGGRPVKAVAEAGKDGFVYVLDRATGKPIRKSQPFVPLEHYMEPYDSVGTIEQPGTLGGSDWSPTAYSPQTGYLYVDGSYMPMKYKLHVTEQLQPPAQWWGGVVNATPSGHWGVVAAIDLATGRVAWQQRMPQPMIAGLVATAGGLVFTGSSDGHLVALDARTGAPLWSYATTGGVNAPPITYAIDGRQYVAVAATGLQTLDTKRGDEMLAFALPTRSAQAAAPSVAPGSGAPADTAATRPRTATGARRHS